jgi:two-component system, LytTR family, sensor kinase
VPLREELDSLAAYVAIENIRFEGRAALVIDASDDARGALVPSFLLQPLVENALRHGLLPETGGRVGVRAEVERGEVHVAVDDDGRSSQSDVAAREGLGLSNTRARLAQMYGDGFSFDIDARENGFGVAMVLPYRCVAKEEMVRAEERRAERYWRRRL